MKFARQMGSTSRALDLSGCRLQALHLMGANVYACTRTPHPLRPCCRAWVGLLRACEAQPCGTWTGSKRIGVLHHIFTT